MVRRVKDPPDQPFSGAAFPPPPILLILSSSSTLFQLQRPTSTVSLWHNTPAWYPLCVLRLHCRLGFVPGTALYRGQLLVVCHLGPSPRLLLSTAASRRLHIPKDCPKDSRGFPSLLLDTTRARNRLRQGRNLLQTARPMHRQTPKTKNRTVCAVSKNPHIRLPSPASLAGIARRIACPNMGTTKERC